MFHEIMHLASSASDKGYSKVKCLNRATYRPELARHNAASYVFYAGEAGQTRTNWLKNTGGAATSPDCKDRYSNCPKIASRCCHNKMRGNRFTKSLCCASCQWADAGTKCGGSRKEDPSRAADAATVAAAKQSALRRRKANDARWKRENNGKIDKTPVKPTKPVA